MHRKYFFLVFLITMIIALPASGSLTKISSGAPVFVGEKNLDISSGLQGCRVIGWWENGTGSTGPSVKNITIIKNVEESNIAFRYTIDPNLYSGSIGPWYCVEKQPPRMVFDVQDPELSVSFRNFDNNKDISGTEVPLSTNISYQITTNLYQALLYRYRPDVTPLDTFFTVSITDPFGREIQSFYTGSYGKADTLIIPFDRKPFITASPFNWKDGGKWDLESRNAQGEFLYPPGTYTITVRQNLNGMDTMYPSGERAGRLEASAAVTFIKPESTPVPSTITTTPSGPAATQVSRTTAPPLTEESTTPGTTPVRTKTTYSPLPLWILPVALALTALALARKRG